MTEPAAQIGIVWPDVSEAPVHRVNQFVSQLEAGGPDGADGILLTLGYVPPPVVIGTPEEVGAMYGALGALSAHAYGRFSMSRQRVVELIQILQTTVGQYDGQAPNQGPEGGSETND